MVQYGKKYIGLNQVEDYEPDDFWANIFMYPYILNYYPIFQKITGFISSLSKDEIPNYDCYGGTEVEPLSEDFDKEILICVFNIILIIT